MLPLSLETTLGLIFSVRTDRMDCSGDSDSIFDVNNDVEGGGDGVVAVCPVAKYRCCCSSYCGLNWPGYW